jgi:hypothetical protein
MQPHACGRSREARGRSVAFAAAAVLESRAFTDLRRCKPCLPLIDFVANDVDDVCSLRLDGRTIKRFDGRSVAIRRKASRHAASR